MGQRGQRKAVLLLVALLFPPLSGVAGPSEDSTVESWLERMDQAITSLNYRGTVVNLRDGQVDTLRIIHRVDEEGVRERIYALDGEPREILRNRNYVRCLLSDTETLLVPNQFPARLLPQLSPEQLGDRDAIYSMSFAGTDRVAGRDTRVIEISPRDRYRYGHRLWLDEGTGMLLRSALLNDRSEIIQQLSFVSIELNAEIGDSELESGFDQSGRVTSFTADHPDTADEDSSPSNPSWIPEHLPQGFRLASVGRSTGPEGQKLEHLLYSDGLASFSIYIEKAREGMAGQALETMGPVHVYTGRLDEHMVTVVGEVPAATVSEIGRHLRRAVYPVLRHYP